MYSTYVQYSSKCTSMLPLVGVLLTTDHAFILSQDVGKRTKSPNVKRYLYKNSTRQCKLQFIDMLKFYARPNSYVCPIASKICMCCLEPWPLIKSTSENIDVPSTTAQSPTRPLIRQPMTAVVNIIPNQCLPNDLFFTVK